MFVAMARENLEGRGLDSTPRAEIGLITMKDTTFSTAIDRVFDIMQSVRIIFETSDTRLLKALCDVKTEGKNDVRGEKIPFDPEHRN